MIFVSYFYVAAFPVRLPVPQSYGVGHMQPAQLPTVQGQATVAHAPPMVSIFISGAPRFVSAFFPHLILPPSLRIE